MEYEINLPSHGKRFLAYIIDMVPITGTVFAYFYFFLGFDEVWNAYLNNIAGEQEQVAFLNWRNNMRMIELGIWVVYSIIMDLSTWQGTLGKRVMGIKVVDQEGKKITLDQSLKRNLLKPLSILGLYIGVIWILFDSYRQSLHDKWAGAYMSVDSKN